MSLPLNLAAISPHPSFRLEDELIDDDVLFLPDGEPSANFDAATVSAITASLAQAQAHREAEEKIEHDHELDDLDALPGEEGAPIASPPASMAPYVKPGRGADTPFPLYMTFVDRADFERWFEGENSWVHYVQRRTTTPEKRAEERLRARERAHESALASMDAAQAAQVAPLRKRKRVRTSPIQEKITYTCHHAGKYSSKHSESLPSDKLRMNTKKSVKCNCQSRVVLTEMIHGDCRAVYHWQHVGHDPFAEAEEDGGRLPKIIDDWILRQVEAGRDTDAIRKVLTMTDEEKRQYVERAANEPDFLTPDMPPPLAVTATVTYPDIYNRFRKLKGPIKATRPPKSRRAASQRLKSSKTTPQPPNIEAETSGPNDAGAPGPSVFGLDTKFQPLVASLSQRTSMPSLRVPAGTDAGSSLQAGPSQASDTNIFDPASHHELAKALSSMSQEQVLQIGSHGGHDELARALLSFMTSGGAV